MSQVLSHPFITGRKAARMVVVVNVVVAINVVIVDVVVVFDD